MLPFIESSLCLCMLAHPITRSGHRMARRHPSYQGLDAQRVVVAGPQGRETVMVGSPRSPQAIMPKEQSTVPCQKA